MRRLRNRRILLFGVALLVAAGTVLTAALSSWLLTVTGLVLLHLCTIVLCWPRRVPTQRVLLTRVDELDQRVEAWGARLTAGTDRLRVEVMDLLMEGSTASEGDKARPGAP